MHGNGPMHGTETGKKGVRVMARVIRFPAARTAERQAAAAAAAGGDGRTAEIIIFPGVRYEYLDDPAPGGDAASDEVTLSGSPREVEQG